MKSSYLTVIISILTCSTNTNGIKFDLESLGKFLNYIHDRLKQIVSEEFAKRYNNIKFHEEPLLETLGETESFVLVNLTLVNIIWNATVMAPQGDYWRNMESSLGSSLLETLDRETNTGIRLLGEDFWDFDFLETFQQS